MLSQYQTTRLLPLLIALVVSAALHAGCHRVTPSEEAGGRMRRLLNPLTDYLEVLQRDEKGPPSDDGFKAFLAGLSKQKLGDLQITDTQEVFVSPRDRKPFVINYRIALSGGQAPALWEQSGQSGLRCVLYQDGKFEELDEEHFSKLAAKWKK